MDEKKIINEIIPRKLKEIEEKENIRILHCVESGSRAWGFPSPDSDFDVRFIYVREKEFYLRLDKTKDYIEWQLDDTLDINGWDIKKALTLLHSSNPTLFEWNNSPIVYKTTKEWQEISKVITHYFKQKAGLYHYLNTARNHYKEYLQGDSVKYKKYFYCLRPILACRYILDKKSPPPMLFEKLKDEYLTGEIKQEVEKLLELKMATPELLNGPKIEIINEYLLYSIKEIELKVKEYKQTESPSFEELNEIFLSLLN